MSEQTREQQLHQIISALFSILDQATLNIATWPQVDALKARYQALQQEQTEEPATPYKGHYTLKEVIVLPGEAEPQQEETQAASRIAQYNREIDERNRIAAESREKPWLPLYDGE